MSKKKKDNQQVEEEETVTEAAEQAEDVAEEVQSPAEETKEPDEVTEMKDKFLRLAADFENFKRRTKTEKEALYNTAAADTVAELLPIIDNLERALDAAKDDDSPLKKGVEMIMSQTSQIFEKMHITAMGEVGEQFDPNVHNAVMHTEDDSVDANTITMVLQRGYKIGDRVIRPALVQVAN